MAESGGVEPDDLDGEHTDDDNSDNDDDDGVGGAVGAVKKDTFMHPLEGKIFFILFHSNSPLT